MKAINKKEALIKEILKAKAEAKASVKHCLSTHCDGGGHCTMI